MIFSKFTLFSQFLDRARNKEHANNAQGCIVVIGVRCDLDKLTNVPDKVYISSSMCKE
jgi:hypothetical protein